MGALCRERGVPLVVAIFPLFGNPLDASYPFAEVHAKVAQAAAEAGAKVVDLLPAYRGSLDAAGRGRRRRRAPERDRPPHRGRRPAEGARRRVARSPRRRGPRRSSCRFRLRPLRACRRADGSYRPSAFGQRARPRGRALAGSGGPACPGPAPPRGFLPGRSARAGRGSRAGRTGSEGHRAARRRPGRRAGSDGARPSSRTPRARHCVLHAFHEPLAQGHRLRPVLQHRPRPGAPVLAVVVVEGRRGPGGPRGAARHRRRGSARSRKRARSAGPPRRTCSSWRRRSAPSRREVGLGRRTVVDDRRAARCPGRRCPRTRSSTTTAGSMARTPRARGAAAPGRCRSRSPRG